MRVTIEIKGDAEIAAKFGQMSTGVALALRAKVTALALKLEALVKTGKLNGQVLNRITGNLARSIDNRVEAAPNSVFGFVYSSGDVKYAAIHEYGGVIAHPGGTSYLPMGATGKVAFVSNLWADGHTPALPKTKPHNITMPERSFLRSSLKDMAVEISTGLKEAVVKAAQEVVA